MAPVFLAQLALPGSAAPKPGAWPADSHWVSDTIRNRLDPPTSVAAPSPVLNDTLMTEVADATDAFVAILNADREIIYANRSLLEESGGELMQALGQRFGELLGCRNSDGAPDGCGTTPECLECGANKAIRAVGRAPQVQEECRILRSSGDPVDLLVTVAPLEIGPQLLTLVTAIDISDRKRREALERIFFHDITNTASGVQGLSSVIQSAPAEEREELLGLLESASTQLIDEIAAQRELLEAETSELVVSPQLTNSRHLLHEVAGLYSSHEACKDKTLTIGPSDDVDLMTDPVLLVRVLGNLTKNALEASSDGDEVSIGCQREGETLRFVVHNPSVMPISVQRQVFQRSFSTKGKGRGLGTYSSRLLTRRYLRGDITFASSAGSGTTFTASYPVSG